MILTARGLSIGWSGRVEKTLASGIDLEVDSGEIAVLVGPNGSGKSTLLRTLAGLQSPLRGVSSIGGKDSSRMGAEERATKVACVFTDRYDSGYFNVFDIVAFGRYPYTDARGRLSRKDSEAVHAAIAAVGLQAFASRRFAELSDGERQKALIARAIAQDCPLLILDEPTAFLDAPARVEIFHLAQSLARSSGKAVVVSTHDIDHALRYADRLWLIDAEHRFRSGSPEDLATSGYIGRAFDGELFKFDIASGAFKSKSPTSPLAVKIEGGSASSRAWTGRLAERLGFLALESGDGGKEAIARIVIEESQGVTLFALWPGKGYEKLEAASYDELAQALKALTRAESR